MNRKQFIQSKGATCANWTWSWSFVNHDERFVIFGAWEDFQDGETQRLFSQSWEVSLVHGRRASGYSQSLEHLELVLKEEYRLFTFKMRKTKETRAADYLGPSKMAGFDKELWEKKLLVVGDNYYAYDPNLAPRLTEEVGQSGAPKSYPEGSVTSVTINARERDPRARAECIAHYGFVCQICDFDFSEIFGEFGRGFIHVHHVIELSAYSEGQETNPIADLVPVCPNCHAMIHRTQPAQTVAALRNLIVDVKNGRVQ